MVLSASKPLNLSAKQPVAFFLVSLLLFLMNTFVLLYRRPSFFALSLLLASLPLLFLCALQFGSRVFSPTQAAERSTSLTPSRRSSLRILQKFAFITGILCFIAGILRVVFLDPSKFMPFQIVGFTLMSLVPEAIANLLGEPLHPVESVNMLKIAPSEAEPIHSDLWAKSPQG